MYISMERDLTFETNNWIIENPDWINYSKSICTSEHHWLGYYGDNYFLKYKEPHELHPKARWLVLFPNIAEHFYALDWRTRRWDTIFASYKLSEIERFVKQLGFLTPFEYNHQTECKYPHRLAMLRVKDLVTDVIYEVQKEQEKVHFLECEDFMYR